MKPFLHHDGNYYPCSSVVLNSDSDGHFHERYRIGKLEEIVDRYLIRTIWKSKPFDSKHCNHCVFCSQNELIDSLMIPSGMEDFIMEAIVLAGGLGLRLVGSIGF